MKNNLSSVVPHYSKKGLEELARNICKDLGFDERDKETTPKIYDALSIIYFFRLGNNLYKNGIIVNENFSNDLRKYLQEKKVISSKPKNYKELKDAFDKLSSETLKYLENKI